ncbi:MAG: nicotinamide riboside transporter PnuC [Bacillota bacterium]
MKVLAIFNKKDICLWAISVAVVTVAFLFGGDPDYMMLATSLLGVSALIFLAKGHYFGNVIIVIFCILYGFISFKTKYYGEMATMLGMTLPMAVLAVVSWVKNPHDGEKTQVEINNVGKKEIVTLLGITVLVTIAFYFILDFLGTASMLFSTLSIATSFFAASLTYKRSELYALAYGLNDMVLIILWAIAMLDDLSYITMVICFVMFFINDIYGYISWLKMKKMQSK